MRSRAATAVLAAVLAAALLGGALALLAVLPARTAEERLATDAIRLLAQRAEVHTHVSTPSRTYRARCRVLPRRREQFTASDGRTLVIEGPYVRERMGGPNLPPAAVEEAYLAGCPRLISRHLGRAIRRGREIEAAPVVFAGVPAREVEVAGAAARIRLIVRRESPEPLGIRVGRARTASYRP